MALGGGLAAAMFGPVQRVGDESNGGGVHNMDGDFEAVRQAFACTACDEARREGLEMFEGLPEELFAQGRGTLAIGVGQAVATGRSGAANGRERAGVQAQTVADIVEADGVRELGEEQTDDVTPRFERAGFFLRARLAGQVRHQMSGNEIAELAKDGELGTGWRGTGLFFHPCLVAGKHRPRQLIFSSRRGMAVK
jgi:hypothetical protein